MELATLEQWTKDHEDKDSERFQAVNTKIDGQTSGLLKWFGFGGVVVVISIAGAWGSLTTQVQSNTDKLKTTLDVKDLSHINAQLNSQTQSINELRGDMKILINKIK